MSVRACPVQSSPCSGRAGREHGEHVADVAVRGGAAWRLGGARWQTKRQRRAKRATSQEVSFPGRRGVAWRAAWHGGEARRLLNPFRFIPAETQLARHGSASMLLALASLPRAPRHRTQAAGITHGTVRAWPVQPGSPLG